MPPLRARDTNPQTMPPSSGSQKRSFETIDLTQSDDECSTSFRAPKVPRSSQASATERSQIPSTPVIPVDDDDDDADDGNEMMLMTQADGVNSDTFELYASVLTKAVGIRYYTGHAAPGERVLLRREPQNQYDSNAIQVLNVRAEQIGHVPRQMAVKLASYMDHGDLLVEGTLAGDPGQFDVPLSIAMFGPSDFESKERIKAKMTRDKLGLDALKREEREAQKRRAAELKKAAQAAKAKGKKPDKAGAMQWANGAGGTGKGAAPETSIEDIIGESQVINPREMAQVAEKFGAQEDALAKLPEEEEPDRLETKMLPYQRQALAWLLEKENPKLPEVGSDAVVQLWKQSKKDFYTNITTNYSFKQDKAEEALKVLARGGILADDMGLGKTLEMIALFLSDKKLHGDHGPTLIVAPVSVMSNWRDQVSRHVSKDDPLRVHIYHGSGRKNMKPAEFNEFDVVITTYGTLSVEWLPKGSKGAPKLPRSSGLYSLRWRRIVLDEGHNIRNPNTKNALAACAIDAHAKWVLTGTPIVNSLKDLYSLVRFVGLTGGLEKLEIFNSLLIRPMNQNQADAHLLLQALMGTLCLRRRKDMSFIDLRLPELTEYVHTIKFSAREQKIYDALQAEAKGLLHHYQAASGRGDGRQAQQTYRHLLEILLRLRQVCNHWKLCQERVSSLLSLLEEQSVVALTPQNRRALQDLLQLAIEGREDCPVCLETARGPVITHCGHAFCGACIARVIETQHRCPMCRSELQDEAALVQPATEFGDDASGPSTSLSAGEEAAGGDGEEDGDTSSKVKALLTILAAAHKKQPGTKVVVFSQWCRFLDLLQPQLAGAGYGLTRIDGSMPAAKRDAALHALDADPTVTVLLASLGVCAVGLNLVAANTVVLCDSWWAPAIEDQAVDRVHRLGQKRETTVWRLVMDGSVEERTLEIQAEKRRLMGLALQEGEAGARRGRKGDALRNIQRLLD